MPAKQLLFRDEARERMRRGLDAMAEAVKVTLGPRGRTVILEREFGPPQVVNSGVLVAKAIELEDRFENMGAQMLREVATRTSEKAGDGTTTAIVLAHAMVSEGMRYLAGGMNPMDLKRDIEEAVEAVVAELQRIARPCASSQEVAQVAAISANNDRSIGELIARALDKVGREGAVSIEDGSGLASELHVVEGLQFDRGFLSPYFINQAAEGIVPGGGVALLRARRVLAALEGTTLDHDCGLRIVARALEEPLRRIVANAGDEPSVVLQRVDEADTPAFGYNAATREYGDLLQMGVIDSAKVTRLALHNAASIAALILTTDCMIATAPPPRQAAAAAAASMPEF